MSMFAWHSDGTWGDTVRFPDGVVLTAAEYALSPFRGWVWAEVPDTDTGADPQVASNTFDLHSKARAALASSVTALAVNATYIARNSTTTAQDKAQLKTLSNQINALIRQVNALTRLALAADLLRDTTGT